MLCDEDVLTFVEAAAILPRLNGKRPHVSTLWRWARRGLNGIRLETRRIGSRFVTSREALERFSAALAAIPLPDRPTAPPKASTNTARAKSVAQAEKVLAKAGIA